MSWATTTSKVVADSRLRPYMQLYEDRECVTKETTQAVMYCYQNGNESH